MKGTNSLVELLGSRTFTTSSEATAQVGSYDRAMRILREASEKGLVERRIVKKGRGHPEYLFSLTLPDYLKSVKGKSSLEKFFRFLSKLRVKIGGEVILGPFVSTAHYGMGVLQPEIRIHATPPERLLVKQFLDNADGLSPYHVIFEERVRDDVERSVAFKRDGIRLGLLSAGGTVLDSLKSGGVYDVLGAIYILQHKKLDYQYLVRCAVAQGLADKLGALLDVGREEGDVVPEEILDVLQYFAEGEREKSLPKGFEESGEYSWLREKWGIRFGLTREEVRHHVTRELEPEDWFNWLLSADRRLAEGGGALAR